MSLEKYLEALEKGITFTDVMSERSLSPEEKKKREEIAQAIEREHPEYDMDKKMAIATAKAKECCDEGFADTYHATKLKVEKEKLRKRGMVDQAEKITLDDIKKKYPIKVNEETEQIDEISKDTLSSYKKKAVSTVRDLKTDVEDDTANRDLAKLQHDSRPDHSEKYRRYAKMQSNLDKSNQKLEKRKQGIKTAVSKLKEEALEEGSWTDERSCYDGPGKGKELTKMSEKEHADAINHHKTQMHQLNTGTHKYSKMYDKQEKQDKYHYHAHKASLHKDALDHHQMYNEDVNEEKDTSALDAMDAKEKRKDKIRQFIKNQSPVKIKRTPGKPEVKEEVENIDEAMGSKQRFDSNLVLHGAMSKAEYDKKWKKNPPKSNGPKDHGTGGMYRSTVKEEVELVESSEFHAKPTASGHEHYAVLDDNKSAWQKKMNTRKDGHTYVGTAGYHKPNEERKPNSGRLYKSGMIVKHKDTGKYAVGNISAKTTWHDTVEHATADAHKRFKMDHQHVTPEHVKVVSRKDYDTHVNKPVSEAFDDSYTKNLPTWKLKDLKKAREGMKNAEDYKKAEAEELKKRGVKEEVELDENKLTGGAKAAYDIGFAHGRRSSQKIDANKSFGSHDKHYHDGYNSGKAAIESEDWHEEQKSRKFKR